MSDQLISLASRADPEVLLPVPTKNRFVPLRLGIINLWQYDSQEFELDEGWLLLRGDNGAGKSKVLEITLPFLFDGQMRAERLDPFGELAKTMKWNLLESVRDSRVGYSWIEFGRLTEDGREKYVTLGVGMRATASMPRVDAWYFVTSLRVDDQLKLPRPGEPMMQKDGLKRQLDGLGDIYETVHEYQAAVDAALFDFGPDRYRDWVDLLLQLRRPQLSNRLRPTELTRLLSESLPPVDEDRITQVADGFEQLDAYKAKIAELGEAQEAIGQYLRYYQTFLRRVVRRSAEALRKANTEVGRDAETLDRAKKAHKARLEELAQFEEQRTANRNRQSRLRGALDVLHESPEMKAAERLAAVDRQASDAKTIKAETEAELRLLREDLERADEQVGKADARVAEAAGPLKRASQETQEAARRADLVGLHDGQLAALLEKPREISLQLVSAARARRGFVEELQELQRDVTHTADRLADARRKTTDADGDHSKALQETRDAEERLGQEQERAAASIQAWWTELREMQVTDDDLVLLQEAVTGHIDFGRAAPRLLMACRDHRKTELEHEQAARLQDLRLLEDEIVRVVEERERVASQEEIGPLPPMTRISSREGRAGSSFYRLFDFRDELSQDDRRLLEAALEAAGILDAWVTPEGDVLAADTFDTLLRPATATQGENLSRALILLDDALVDRRVAQSVLSAIGLGRSDHVCWVDLDGSWRLGPLEGRGSKERAEYLGSSAREAFRQRRLQQLAETLGELEEKRTELRLRMGALDELTRALAKEYGAFPDDTEVTKAHSDVQAARVQSRNAERWLTVAQEAERNVTLERDTATQRLESRAGALGLRGQLSDLAGMIHWIDDYIEGCHRLAFAADGAKSAATDLERAEADRGRIRERITDKKSLVQARAQTYLRYQAAADELRESREGLAAEDVIKRAEDLRQDLHTIERGLDELEDQINEANRLEGEATQSVRSLEEKHKASTEVRLTAAYELIALVKEGAVALALDQEILIKGEWHMTRALELARRQIEPALQGQETAPELIDRARDRLTDALRELDRQIPQYQPSQETRLDGAFIAATAVYNGRTVSIGDLGLKLAEEASVQQEMFNRGEAELVERYLLGDVADHLGERMQRAQERLQQINELMRRHPTASDMTLSLRWNPDLEDATHAAALKFLNKDPSLLRDDQRQLLREFFQERIRSAREQSDNRNWREHLLDALDYRKWYRLTIWKNQNGQSNQLTDRSHGTGSGGEKAVTLHLPLFAAAAAYYDSSPKPCPRLIMLDEAFAGIDHSMRGRCMAMLGSFDLDLVMTSDNEIGTHEEVRFLSIYHLLRDPAFRGVLAERWNWNGEVLSKVADAP